MNCSTSFLTGVQNILIIVYHYIKSVPAVTTDNLDRKNSGRNRSSPELSFIEEHVSWAHSLIRTKFLYNYIVLSTIINTCMAYSKEVIERFESVLNNPHKHSVGRFDPNDPNVATGMVGAPSCGDVMKLDLKLDIEGLIKDVKFKTYGCGSAIASSSLFVDMLKGRTVEQAKQIKDKDIAEILDLPPIKLHCSVLAEEAITKAIEDWESKKK